MKSQESKSIVCFGEVLWDILPTSKQVGGAPLNVAFHLNSLGLNSRIISKIGNDDLGKELLNYAQAGKLDTSLIQEGESHLTGVAKANISDRNEVTYKILQPVAWDYIEPHWKGKTAVEESSAFVFGSLATRGGCTYNTLRELLDLASYKVFDVNLRKPFYSPEIINDLFSKANLIKMNEHELAIISDWNDIEGDEKSCVKSLADKYKSEAICITRGAEGALLYKEGAFYQQTGFEVEVKDTIGSGDAFLAGLLNSLLSHQFPEKALEFACAMGSLVATYHGATPVITIDMVDEFLKNTKTNFNL